MSQFWESTFATWAQAPSATEQERIENAIRAIRRAIDLAPEIAQATKVFPQGSYRNRVNVRQDSDIDVGVLYTGSTVYLDIPPGYTKEQFGYSDAEYEYSTFKDSVGRALVSHFGAGAVTRGNKAFDVHANTYRLDADVVPVFVHRRYKPDRTFISGVEFTADDGTQVINWPERLYDNAQWPKQHYENGNNKNTRTNRAYRGVVRILKKLKCKMADEGIEAAKAINGFLVECLVWNAPDHCFAHGTWDQCVQSVLAFLWGATRSDADCNEWGEVSELKYLFRASAGKRAAAHAFLNTAWSYIGVRR